MTDAPGEEARTCQEPEETLPGMGPKVEVARLRKTPSVDRSSPLTADEAAILDQMRAQVDRYEWFAARVDLGRSLEELAAALFRKVSAPGQCEHALVELSLRVEDEAHALLEEWQPSADRPELCLFHQICVSRARRRP